MKSSTKWRQLDGLWAPKRGRRGLWRIRVNTSIESWDEYIVAKDRAEVDQFMAEQDLVSGEGNCSVEVFQATGFGLDSLWITRRDYAP